jgi:SNF2 family DNA or RNA helicase
MKIKKELVESASEVRRWRRYAEIDMPDGRERKCIVFSQFTSMLDICHFRLQQVLPVTL